VAGPAIGVTRTIELASAFMRWAKRPTVQRIGFALAALLFIGGAYYSWQDIGLDLTKASCGYLWLLGLAAVPLMVALNVLEFVFAARLVGVKVAWLAGFRISVLSSAANLLPLPAGPMMRAVAIADGGGTAKSGAVAVLFPAGIWLGVGFGLSAFAMVLLGPILWAVLLGGIGFLLLAGCMYVVRRAPMDNGAMYWLFGIKLLAALVDILAIYWALQFIGDPASPVQAMSLAASAPLGAAVSVVPAGLGVREMAAAALGLLVGLTAAQAFLAPAILRLVYLLGLGVISPFMLVMVSKK